MEINFLCLLGRELLSSEDHGRRRHDGSGPLHRVREPRGGSAHGHAAIAAAATAALPARPPHSAHPRPPARLSPVLTATVQERVSVKKDKERENETLSFRSSLWRVCAPITVVVK
jgi:hypothetical protein